MQWVILLFCLLPRDDVTRDSVDLVEVNHFYDEQGRLIFDQILFYEWSSKNARFQILDKFRLVKFKDNYPCWDHDANRWVSHFIEMDRHRKVYARFQKETWTQYDPELLEREILPSEKRRPLTNIPPPKAAFTPKAISP